MKYIDDPRYPDTRVTLLSIESTRSPRRYAQQATLASIAMSTGVQLAMNNAHLLNDYERRRLQEANELADNLFNQRHKQHSTGQPSRQHIFNRHETNLIEDGLEYLSDLSKAKLIETAKRKSIKSALTRLSLVSSAANESFELTSQQLSS